MAPYLSEPIGNARYEFFGRFLGGQAQPRARWKRGVSTVNVLLADAIGRLYLEQQSVKASRTRVEKIAAEVIRGLRRDAPADAGLPTARDWFEAFARHRAEHGGAGPLPRAIFERGEATYRELLDSSSAPVLLHGDLHHYNVLSAERAPWLAIDPHGLTGDPVFEVGAYFGNPSGLMSRVHPERIIERRVDVLTERLGYDRQRIIAWGLAYQTLSAVWSAENNGTNWGNAITVAEILGRTK